MKIKTMIAILAIAMAFTGCQKPEKGEAGTPGVNGKDGNANVGHSSPFTINNFIYYSATTEYRANLTLSSITQEVVDGGVVMVYLQSGSGWVPLPVNDGTSTMMYEFHLGGLIIYWFNNNGSVPSNPNGGFTIRSVVIPPAIIKNNPNIDLNNYSEVKHAMKLKD